MLGRAPRFETPEPGYTPNQVPGVSVPVVLTNRSAPPATVTPVLVYPDVRAAVTWLDAAFGFGERVRIGDSHRAQLRVGADGAVVIAAGHRWDLTQTVRDCAPEDWGGVTIAPW